MYGGRPGIFEVVAAFVRLDGCDEIADMAAYIVDAALLGGAHPVLDLGEGLFDRVEVGRVCGRYQSFAPAAPIEVDPGFWTSGLGGADAVPF